MVLLVHYVLDFYKIQHKFTINFLIFFSSSLESQGIVINHNLEIEGGDELAANEMMNMACPPEEVDRTFVKKARPGGRRAPRKNPAVAL